MSSGSAIISDVRTDPVTVGELFPADDLVAQWVFSLSAVAEDLSITEAAFQEVLHGDRGALWTGYHFRQVIARLYEAERPIVSAHQREEVKRFLASVPDAAEHLDFLVGYYVASAGETSRVRTVFGGIRHRTVHHSWIGSRELHDALRAARDEEARILINRNEEWLHHEWPEAVALRALLGDLDDRDARAAFVEQTELAQEILRHLVALVKLTLDEHVRRRGVDPARLMFRPQRQSPGAWIGALCERLGPSCPRSRSRRSPHRRRRRGGTRLLGWPDHGGGGSLRP
jgi:hypothetical protein